MAMMAAAALTLLSCEKYDDGKPQKNVRSEFNRMYPGARDVTSDGIISVSSLGI